MRTETLQGKGNVVRRMFADIEADIYVLVDGDDTYDAASAPRMIKALLDGPLDMVNGARVTEIEKAYRPGHRFGNWLLTIWWRGLSATVFPICCRAIACCRGAMSKVSRLWRPASKPRPN